MNNYNGTCWFPNIQVSSFTAKGVSAAAMTGDQDDEKVKSGITTCTFKLVYFTPEMLLLNRTWRELLTTPFYHERLRAVVIDEAHTVKKGYVIYCFDIY